MRKQRQWHEENKDKRLSEIDLLVVSPPVLNVCLQEDQMYASEAVEWRRIAKHCYLLIRYYDKVAWHLVWHFPLVMTSIQLALPCHRDQTL